MIVLQKQLGYIDKTDNGYVIWGYNNWKDGYFILDITEELEEAEYYLQEYIAGLTVGGRYQ